MSYRYNDGKESTVTEETNKLGQVVNRESSNYDPDIARFHDNFENMYNSERGREYAAHENRYNTFEPPSYHGPSDEEFSEESYDSPSMSDNEEALSMPEEKLEIDPD